MPDPTSESVTVKTDTLRAEAKVWDDQSGQLHTISQKATELSISRLRAGVFQVIVSAYSDVVKDVATRGKEGHDRMVDIATVLRRVAADYDRVDGGH
jgi:hypothetical protein